MGELARSVKPCPQVAPQSTARKARAPYSARAAAWSEAQEHTLEAAGVGRSFRQAIRRWATQETRAGRPLDFTPHQLAKLGGCHVRTVYREIPRAIAAHLVNLIQPGNRGIHKAAVLQLSTDWPTWSQPGVRATKSPSPGDLRSQENKSPTYAPEPSPSPLPTAAATPPERNGAHEGAFGAGQGGQEPLKGPERILANLLAREGCQARGIRSALKAAEGRIQEALRDVRTVLAYLQTEPSWITPGRQAGVLIRAIQDPARASKWRRQLRYHRLQVRRTQAKAATNPPLKAEPVTVDFRELLEDSQEIFAGLTPDQRAWIQHQAEGKGDRAFIRAVSTVLESIRKKQPFHGYA